MQHADLETRTLAERDSGRLGYERSDAYYPRPSSPRPTSTRPPRPRLNGKFREYNHSSAEYYSRDGHCYQRGGAIKRNWFLWHKWTSFVRNGGFIELNPISNHWPDNKRYVERNRDNPSLFFDDDYIALDDSGLNFKTVDGWDHKWYLTDEYIASGAWMEHNDLAALLIFYNAFRIIDFLEFSEYAENISAETDHVIREGIREKILIAIAESVLSKSIKRSLPQMLSSAIPFVNVASWVQTAYSEIRTRLKCQHYWLLVNEEKVEY